MPRSQKTKREYDRLTVPLAEGQRDGLSRIAERNNASLAFVVRYALDEFLQRHKDGQLTLNFPQQP